MKIKKQHIMNLTTIFFTATGLMMIIFYPNYEINFPMKDGFAFGIICLFFGAFTNLGSLVADNEEDILLLMLVAKTHEEIISEIFPDINVTEYAERVMKKHGNEKRDNN
jgi:hypothetical protein